MVKGYISLADARASQANALETAIAAIGSEVRNASSALKGAGPIFMGIGASFAASSAAVWALRSRGVHSWRLNGGEYPIPFPASSHPVIAVSQSGKSTETLAVLNSIDRSLRISVVNAKDSPSRPARRPIFRSARSQTATHRRSAIQQRSQLLA